MSSTTKPENSQIDSFAETSSVVDDYDIIDDHGPSEEFEERAQTSLVRFDPLQKYLMEISRYPLLTREEEHEIALSSAMSERKSAEVQNLIVNVSPAGCVGAHPP